MHKPGAQLGDWYRRSSVLRMLKGYEDIIFLAVFESTQLYQHTPYSALNGFSPRDRIYIVEWADKSGWVFCLLRGSSRSQNVIHLM